MHLFDVLIGETRMDPKLRLGEGNLSMLVYWGSLCWLILLLIFRSLQFDGFLSIRTRDGWSEKMFNILVFGLLLIGVWSTTFGCVDSLLTSFCWGAIFGKSRRCYNQRLKHTEMAEETFITSCNQVAQYRVVISENLILSPRPNSEYLSQWFSTFFPRGTLKGSVWAPAEPSGLCSVSL